MKLPICTPIFRGEMADMSRKRKKEQIKQLKTELRAAYQASNYRLLKLALLMAVLAIIAAYMYGHIHT